MGTVRWLIRLMAMLAVACAGVVFPTTLAWACTCTAQSDKEHYDAASVVFTGRATSQREDGRFIAFVFDVDDVSKGRVTDGVEVRASTVDVEGCGLTFDPETDYQVFGYLDSGVLMTGLCTGSHVISEQQPVVPAPGDQPPQPPVSPPATTTPPLPVETSRPPASVSPGPQTLSPSPSAASSGDSPTAGDNSGSDGDSSTGLLLVLAGLLAAGLAGLGYVVARRRRP